MASPDELLRERLPVDEILDFCRRTPVKTLWVFGSVLGDWRENSDVDLLVEFFPGQEPDLLGRLDLQDELAALVGHPVDLVPRDSVTNPYRRQSIWETRFRLYAA